jgi:Calpain family cysteine protease
MEWLDGAFRKLNLRPGKRNETLQGTDLDGNDSGRRRSSRNGTSGIKKKAASCPASNGSNINTRGVKPSKAAAANDTAAFQGAVTSATRHRTVTVKSRPDPCANTAHSKPNNSNIADGNTTYKKKLLPPVKAKGGTQAKVRPAVPAKKSQGTPSRTKQAAGGASFPLPANVPEQYQDADPSKWQLKTVSYSGGSSFLTCGKQEQVSGKSIAKATQLFKANPGSYVALMYQTSIAAWPEKEHTYTLVHREGTNGYQPQGVGPEGWMTIMLYEYRRLPPYKGDILPMKFRDKYTDSMTHKGRMLHSTSNRPIMPGRGMGVGDAPNLKLFGNVDPSDIHQGSVGDCWLLSGISALAEFDGAVKRLFRKTKNLNRRPLDGPNMYTVTLWDISTWKEVDIEIDERLPVRGGGAGGLLASRPSVDGELWACYLEKALAVHCGGWDKITGGKLLQVVSLCLRDELANTSLSASAFLVSSIYTKVNVLMRGLS